MFSRSPNHTTHGFVWAMSSRRINNFPESRRGLGHVTLTIFGSTVGYPSDSLASCFPCDSMALVNKSWKCPTTEDVIMINDVFVVLQQRRCVSTSAVTETLSIAWSWKTRRQNDPGTIGRHLWLCDDWGLILVLKLWQRRDKKRWRPLPTRRLNDYGTILSLIPVVNLLCVQYIWDIALRLIFRSCLGR